jgi:hypothetical protein
MATFNTIHIFGFGTIQVIGKDLNVQTPIANVQAQADACINNVWSKKPTDSTITKQYHAVNVFNGMFADWQTKVKGEKGFRAKYEELDGSLFQALAQAVIDAQPTPTTPQP